jgi:hypothetical protein
MFMKGLHGFLLKPIPLPGIPGRKMKDDQLLHPGLSSKNSRLMGREVVPVGGLFPVFGQKWGFAK